MNHPESPPETTLTVPLGGGRTITALRTDAATPTGCVLLYAPGAGSNIRDPFGAYLCHELAERGAASSLRFQFPYMEAGKRSPDRPGVLEEIWRAVIAFARADAELLVAGGRSMGGRIASQVAASGAPVDALALFAYPLYPPGRPDRIRDAHLPSITVPTLFCSGTNDAFAAPDELRAAAALTARPTVHLLEHADHGFSAPKASGRTRPDIWEEATTAMIDWLTTQAPPGG